MHYDYVGAWRSVSSRSQRSAPSIFSRGFLEFEPVVGVLPPAVDEVLLALLVL